jgi:hypothetical protein
MPMTPWSWLQDWCRPTQRERRSRRGHLRQHRLGPAVKMAGELAISLRTSSELSRVTAAIRLLDRTQKVAQYPVDGFALLARRLERGGSRWRRAR